MEAALPAILGSVASSVVSSLLTKKPDAPAAAPPPVVAPVTAMPDPLAQKQVQRRKAAKMFEGQLTSADTVLTGRDTLG